MTFGGPLLIAAALAAAVIELGRALRSCRRPAPAALLALGAALAVELARPWMRGWGSSAEERAMALPGDELVPEPGVVITQAVTIAAPADAVWPWIAQIGQDRGGFYSYEWLENLAGCELRNADRVHPEWQRRELGEQVPLHPLNGLAVTIFDPGRTLGLEGWGVFHLQPAADGSTRLLARGRIPAGAPSLFYRAIVELPHFVMQRKMLLEITRMAEAEAADPVPG